MREYSTDERTTPEIPVFAFGFVQNANVCGESRSDVRDSTAEFPNVFCADSFKLFSNYEIFLVAYTLRVLSFGLTSSVKQQ